MFKKFIVYPPLPYQGWFGSEKPAFSQVILFVVCIFYVAKGSQLVKKWKKNHLKIDFLQTKYLSATKFIGMND